MGRIEEQEANPVRFHSGKRILQIFWAFYWVGSEV
jgi:hypothetical protein